VGLQGGSWAFVIDELTFGCCAVWGSEAVQRGLVSKRVLRGNRYRRLFHGIYLSASAPVNLSVRSQAAALLAPGHGVLSGYSAIALLGARCAPADANAELTIPGRDLREQPGLTVHRDLLADDEITDVGGLPITDSRAQSPMETRSRLVLVLRGLPRLESVAGPERDQMGRRRKIGRGMWRSADMM
jgi:hypothetical protein